MTLNEYQEAALKTAGDRGEQALVYAAFAVSGEAGEFADAVKKMTFHGYSMDTGKLTEELGDILWGIAYAAQSLGTTLDEVAAQNVAKLAKRYPEGFVPKGGVR